MNTLFPVSELLIAALFACGLLWLVIDVARRHPRDAVVMIADPERFARMAATPQQRRLQGHRQVQRREADFPSAAVC